MLTADRGSRRLRRSMASMENDLRFTKSTARSAKPMPLDECTDAGSFPRLRHGLNDRAGFGTSLCTVSALAGVPPVLGHGQDGHGTAEPVSGGNGRIQARQDLVKRGATAIGAMPFPTGRKFIKEFSFLSDRKPDSTKILLDSSLVVLYTG